MITKLSQITHQKHEIDARDQILGRLASAVALKLTGKSKSYFVRHLDCGDFVTVTNASQIKVTGKKLTQKVYTRYSGYPGGIKNTRLDKSLSQTPAWVIRHAVSGMLPNNKLKSLWLKRLTIKS